MEEVGDIRRDEYELRFKKAKQLMEQNSIDAILVSSYAEGYYFTGDEHDAWDFEITMGVLPRDGEPVLMTQLLQRWNAERSSWIKDIRVWGTTIPPFESNRVKFITDNLKDMGLSKGVIGIDLESNRHYPGPNTARLGFPLVDYDKIRGTLPEARFVDASPVIWPVRMIKCEAEIERYKRAVYLTLKGVRAGFESIRKGMTEIELNNIMLMEMIRLGADWGSFFSVRSGPDRLTGFDTYASRFNKIKEGDIIKFDGGCRYRGYVCDISRMAFVGKPNERQLDMSDTVWKANEAGQEAMKPGNTVANVFNSAYGVHQERGYAKNIVGYFGHGIGLQIHEPPYINPGTTTVIRPGMTFALEPMIYDPPDFKFNANFTAEDNVVVTDRGCENLSKDLRGLWPDWLISG